MDYRKLGRTGLRVSELCLGTMQFGWTTDESHARAILDAFVDAGGNFIDTADVYTWWGPRGMAGLGGAEEIIGRWLKDRGGREDLVIATKLRGNMGGGPADEGLSRQRVLAGCDASLRRLQTDRIELYQCHWTDLQTPIEETLGAMDELVRAGKVRFVGASNYPAWRLTEALWQADKRGLPRLECYQPQYSLVEAAMFELEAMSLCRHHGLGVIPYSPLGGGFLTGKYRRGTRAESVRAPEVTRHYDNEDCHKIVDTLEEIGRARGQTIAATALAWLLGNPVVTAPIIGANSVEQLQTSLDVVGYRLTDAELARLNALTKSHRNHRPIWD